MSISRSRLALALATAGTLSLGLVAGPVAGPVGAAPRELRTPPGNLDARSGLTAKAGLGFAATHERRAPARVSMLATAPTVALASCQDDAEWLCGNVKVPFDRAHPQGRKIGIAFRVLPHSDPGSTATDAVFASDGGPGAANSGSAGFLRFLTDGLTDERDLVLVDHRGTGQSGAIVCPRLDRTIGDLTLPARTILRTIGRCGHQLGDDADRYGSGDVAMDLDAVRRALGYQKIDLYGLSYAGVFLTAYATRFADHLRTLTIDAGTPAIDARHSWTWGQDVPPALARGAFLECRRAPACRAAQPDAATSYARLARSLRRHPVRGTVDVPTIGERHLVVDEESFIGLSRDRSSASDIAAAATALDHGDAKPVLRLAGEALLNAFQPEDPTVFSAGDNAAVFCNDQDFVWDRSDPLRVRDAKYRRSFHRLAARQAFAPLSAHAWEQHYLTKYCVRWPKPDRFTPAYQHGATVTDVPVLILSGDRDTDVPTRTTRELLDVFPAATFMKVFGAAHPAAGWSFCADQHFQDFVRTLDLPDADACSAPDNIEQVTWSFPLRLQDADEAPATAGDASTSADRRLATAAVQTVRDAWLRSFRVPGAQATVAGLRGGSSVFDYTGDAAATVDLDAMQFVRNVAVTGSSATTYETGILGFDVTVDGPGGRDGELSGAGVLGFNGVYEDFDVTGTVGGREVHVTVPAN